MRHMISNSDHQEESHRIANHLAMLVGMIQTQIVQVRGGPDLLRRDQVGDMLREAAGRILSIAQLHRHLAERPESGMIDVGAFLVEIVGDLRASLSLSEKLSIWQRFDAHCMVTAEQARTLGIIIAEIAMNAVKHAHPTGLRTELSIVCSATKNGMLALEFCDDGVGLPEGFDPETDGGTGFRLIRTLARSIGAEMRIDSDDLGLCFHLLVPNAMKDDSHAANGSAVAQIREIHDSRQLAEAGMEL